MRDDPRQDQRTQDGEQCEARRELRRLGLRVRALGEPPTRERGTGRRLDWKALAAANLPRERLVLAGGLLPSNVDGAIKLARPFAVDVSSGIEGTPGVKDPRLMRAFFGVVAGADISRGAAW